MQKKRAAIDYANETNLVNIGDIVEDHSGRLMVAKIGYYIDYNDPSCIYHGVRLTKAGKPIKGESFPVYQSNLKTK